MALKIGCCGFGETQKRYFVRFPVVEIQQSFYQPPRPDTARRWRREAGTSFVFTLKAWQMITHDPTYRRLTKKLSPQELDRLLEHCRGREGFVLFNNTNRKDGCPTLFRPGSENAVTPKREGTHATQAEKSPNTTILEYCP
jgi:hypothetical protein